MITFKKRKIAEKKKMTLIEDQEEETQSKSSTEETRLQGDQGEKPHKKLITASSVQASGPTKEIDLKVVHKSGHESATNAYSKLKEELENQEGLESKKRDERTDLQKMRDRNEKSSKFYATVGPVRSFNTIKHTNTIDYNPSRCKDFFEAGYCVFGNSCIFIHDRNDYKFGWEEERDWEQKQKRKMERRQRRLEAAEEGREDEVSLSTEDEEVDANEEPAKYGHIDPKCTICGGQYVNPTLIDCGHVFCDRCAQQQYMSTGKCSKCGKKNQGIFNSGAKILEKAKAEREERAALKLARKKAVGMAPSYLRDLTRESKKFNGMVDTEEPVVVPEEDIQKAMARINNKDQV